MLTYGEWYESHMIAGKTIKSREDGASLTQLKDEIDKLIDIIMDPNVEPADKKKAQELASRFATIIKRSGLLEPVGA